MHAFEDALVEMGPVLDPVWATIAQQSVRPGPVRVLFVAAQSGDGTTTLATATAIALARNVRASVTLVEANLHRPVLARELEMPGEPGLTDLLSGRATLADCIRIPPECAGLGILPAGVRRTSVVGEFAGPGADKVFREIEDSSRFVLFDAPPLLEYAETRLLLTRVDFAVLVLRARSTRKDSALRMRRVLDQAGVPILGAILNRYKSDLPFHLGSRRLEGSGH